MDFNDFFGPKPSVIDLHAKDRWEAIDELVGHLAVTNKISGMDFGVGSCSAA